MTAVASDADAATAALVEAGARAIDPLAQEVARAQARATLFGKDEPVTVGRYRLVAPAGRGGMGVVWSARDPELDRTVAVKLAATGSAALRDRVRREGRALAQLSHPNVVPIYDVVERGDQVFLVMELVSGDDLRRHAAARPGARAIVDAYRQAAAGLAAAHAAGIVHRDFKPDNAVIGKDGRVRVVDFGLASAEATGVEIAGTPAYMAPEQRAGVVAATIDQYALGVALREALAPKPPRWVAPIVARLTADDPAARFPSMDAVAAALARDPARRWRVAALAVAALAIAAVAVAITTRQSSTALPRCDGGVALMAETWLAARPAVAAHLATLGPYAAVAAPPLLGRLDGFAAAWRVQHRATCEARRAGALSIAQLERRTECLATARTALATLVELAGHSDRDRVPALVQAAAALPVVARCTDDAALARPVDAPTAAQAATVAVIDGELARAAVWRDGGRIERATTAASEAVTRAEAAAHAPTLAYALLARGRIALTAGSGDRGAADFTRATRTALGCGDDAIAVEAFARDAYARATGPTPQPIDGLTLIEPLASRLPATQQFAVALLQQNLGAVALARADRAAARPRFEAALAAAGEFSSDGGLELTEALLGAGLATDDDARRTALLERLIVLRTAMVGADHPLTLRARIVAAQLVGSRAATRAALVEPCERLRALHPQIVGALASCASDLAWTALVDGDRAAARRWSDAIIALGEPAPPIARALATGVDAVARGDLSVARIALAELTAVSADAPWFRRVTAVDALVVLAIAAGDDDVARRRALDEARALLAAVGPAASPPILALRAAAITELTR